MALLSFIYDQVKTFKVHRRYLEYAQSAKETERWFCLRLSNDMCNSNEQLKAKTERDREKKTRTNLID